MTDVIVADLRRQLSMLADPDVAAGMGAYMRHRFDFLGVKTPQRRRASSSLVKASKHLDVGELLGVVDRLRAEDEREFHYVASDVLRANDSRLPATCLGEVERWITTDAWWDTVDAIASPTVGTMVQRHADVADAMDVWIEADDVWLARTAIIHQLRFGETTDVDRLFRYALRRGADDEFFIRKAIGWALRQYARTDPDAVRAFVRSHDDALSTLTIREATKHLT